MAIRILDYSEALAGPPKFPRPAKWPETLLAKSDALRTLVMEMDRHCNRTIGGRSFLIGGSRGAGKTTLAKAAIEEVGAIQRKQALPHIPLYVPLHGATLLREFDVLGEKSPLKDLEPGLKQMFISLRAITIALQHAFVTELGWAFEGRLNNDADLREIAAQLRINLDRSVELRSLRWFWKRTKLLADGVLRHGETTDPKDHYFTNQGSLDLVATWSVMDAFVRAAAEVDDKESSRSEAELKLEQQQVKDDSRKQMLNSIAGILAGSVAGVGAGVGSPYLGALTFVVTAAVATLTLNFVSKRTVSQTQWRERNITWDSSVKSLEIILPHVINRIRDAGRTPIFVIDELDKVENLDVKLEILMSHLKNIIADDAFFCFLVGRRYYETLQSVSRNTPERKEYSFFRERLFAVVKPSDWHEYLGKRFVAEDGPEPGEKAKSELDKLALEYILLAQGKMYALDVARAIEALKTVDQADGKVIDIVPGQISGLPVFKNLVLMQAVVEFLLADPALAGRIDRDPGFLQMVYDAIYFLYRRWELNQPPVIDRESVLEYLLRLRQTEHRSEPPQGSPLASDLVDGL